MTTFHLSYMHYIYLFSLLHRSHTTHAESPSTYWKIEEGSDITGIYTHGSSCITYLQFTSALHIIISSDLKQTSNLIRLIGLLLNAILLRLQLNLNLLSKFFGTHSHLFNVST